MAPAEEEETGSGVVALVGISPVPLHGALSLSQPGLPVPTRSQYCSCWLIYLSPEGPPDGKTVGCGAVRTGFVSAVTRELCDLRQFVP